MKSAEGSSKAGLIPADLLLAAYAAGFFPMANEETGEIGWYSPDPRAVVPLEQFRISRSLRQALVKGLFTVRYNTAFEEVMRQCASRKETWISEEIVQSYRELHRIGYAHSVETWQGDLLAGGLYGVALGGAFFGESMFSRVTNASKVALVRLVERLRERGFELLDTQYMTPHLARFGAVLIPRGEYLARLHAAVSKRRRFGD